MEYDMDLGEFSCFQWIKYGYEGVFLFLMGYDFFCFYGYRGVFLLLMEYDMDDIVEFSCF